MLRRTVGRINGTESVASKTDGIVTSEEREMDSSQMVAFGFTDPGSIEDSILPTEMSVSESAAREGSDTLKSIRQSSTEGRGAGSAEEESIEESPAEGRGAWTTLFLLGHGVIIRNSQEQS